MKINAEIICERLKGKCNVVLKGKKNKRLTLRRVEFYDMSEVLREDSLYLADSDSLRVCLPEFSGMSFVCVGRVPSWLNSQRNCCVLIVDEDKSLVDVFRAVQRIFFYYESWEDEMIELLRTSSDLVEMVKRSVPIFENPIQISDHQYNLLARTSVKRSGSGRIESFSVEPLKAVTTPEILETLKNDHPKDRLKRKPYFYKDSRYCINLFVHERFVGNMQLIPFIHPLTPGEMALFEYFSRLIVEALQKYTMLSNSRVHTRKSMLKSLLEQKPIDKNWLHQISLSEEGLPDRCVCFQLRIYGDSYALPYEAICQSIEGVLPGSVAFEHGSVIAVFLSLVDCPYPFEACLDYMEHLLDKIGFIAGISDCFEDVHNARHYFLQAGCALETGMDTTPGKRYYLFSDYALSYMLTGCVRDLKADFLCPRGLIKLRNRDAETSGDYWHTLTVYLDNKMNATQSAKQLFLHRSSMIQKLERINDILGVDLNDADMRLYVQLCMKLIDKVSE